MAVVRSQRRERQVVQELRPVFSVVDESRSIGRVPLQGVSQAYDLLEIGGTALQEPTVAANKLVRIIPDACVA